MSTLRIARSSPRRGLLAGALALLASASAAVAMTAHATNPALPISPPPSQVVATAAVATGAGTRAQVRSQDGGGDERIVVREGDGRVGDVARRDGRGR